MCPLWVVFLACVFSMILGWIGCSLFTGSKMADNLRQIAFQEQKIASLEASQGKLYGLIQELQNQIEAYLPKE